MATLQVPPTACTVLGKSVRKYFSLKSALGDLCFAMTFKDRFSGALLMLSETFESRFLGHLLACSLVACNLILPYPLAVGRGTHFTGKVIVKLNIKLSKN